MYDYKKLEEDIKQFRKQNQTAKIDVKNVKNPFYNLMMFPYPSAEGLHVGNCYAFIGTDVFGKFTRMQGKDVFEPIGYDAFGIHSENFAMKKGIHPAQLVKNNTGHFHNQLDSLGNLYDRDYEVNTTTPEYYKRTQWIFTKLYEMGLAYKKKSLVNRCPDCKTVISDEQVIDGKCERHGDTTVEKKEIEAWFFKITDFANELYDKLDEINRSEKTKIAQKNWIGRSEGIEIDYEIEGSNEKVIVFTTRPDTNFGATFVVVAPEYKGLDYLVKPEHKKQTDEYIKKSIQKTDIERLVEGKKKTGVFTGSYAINQLTGYRMPIWISDFVLAGFGTGAVVGVPGHDIRDFQFAKEFNIPIIRVVIGKDGDDSEITKEEQVQEENGIMINSGFLDGLDIHLATIKIMDYIEEKGYGRRIKKFRLRDRCISRQRYRGPPIPVVYCDHCDVKSEINFYNSETWNAIVNGTKTIETRALNPEESDRFFGNVQVGDKIKMTFAGTKEDRKCLEYVKSKKRDIVEKTDDEFVKITRAIIKNEKGQILAMKEIRFDHYTIPGGKIEKGQNPEEAVIREIEEEIGVGVKSIKFVGAVKNILQIHPVLTSFFEVEVSEKPIIGEKDKFSELVRVDIDTKIDTKKNKNYRSQRVGHNVLAKFLSYNELYNQNNKKIKGKFEKCKLSSLHNKKETEKGTIIFNGENIYKHFSTKNKKELLKRIKFANIVCDNLENMFFVEENIAILIYKNTVIRIIIDKQSNGNYYVKTYYIDNKITELYREINISNIHSDKILVNEKIKSLAIYDFDGNKKIEVSDFVVGDKNEIFQDGLFNIRLCYNIDRKSVGDGNYEYKLPKIDELKYDEMYVQYLDLEEKKYKIVRKSDFEKNFVQLCEKTLCNFVSQFNIIFLGEYQGGTIATGLRANAIIYNRPWKYDSKLYTVTKTYKRANLQELRNEDTEVQRRIRRNPKEFEKISNYENFEKYRDFAPGYVDKINKNGLVGREIVPASPAIHCVPVENLPVRLPETENRRPEGNGMSPLANIPEFCHTTCPKCGGQARRETDVMDNFLDSARYFFRYLDPKNDKEAFSPELAKKRLPVDMYIGGNEHAVLHLLYVRFITKALKKAGLVDFDEPFKRFFAHGLIIKDGQKMSKSKGNVINPDDYFSKYGADTLRMYLSFMGPLEAGGDFSDEGIQGMYRFINKSYNFWTDANLDEDKTSSDHFLINKIIQACSDAYSNLKYNVAIARTMEYFNTISKKTTPTRYEMEVFCQMLAPVAPFFTEDLRIGKLGNTTSIHKSLRPSIDDTVDMSSQMIDFPIQFNGKMRGTLSVSPTITQDEIMQLINSDEKLKKYLSDSIKKIIFVPGKICNVIVG